MPGGPRAPRRRARSPGPLVRRGGPLPPDRPLERSLPRCRSHCTRRRRRRGRHRRGSCVSPGGSRRPARIRVPSADGPRGPPRRAARGGFPLVQTSRGCGPGSALRRQERGRGGARASAAPGDGGGRGALARRGVSSRPPRRVGGRDGGGSSPRGGRARARQGRRGAHGGSPCRHREGSRHHRSSLHRHSSRRATQTGRGGGRDGTRAVQRRLPRRGSRRAQARAAAPRQGGRRAILRRARGERASGSGRVRSSAPPRNRIVLPRGGAHVFAQRVTVAGFRAPASLREGPADGHLHRGDSGGASRRVRQRTSRGRGAAPVPVQRRVPVHALVGTAGGGARGWRRRRQTRPLDRIHAAVHQRIALRGVRVGSRGRGRVRPFRGRGGARSRGVGASAAAQHSGTTRGGGGEGWVRGRSRRVWQGGAAALHDGVASSDGRDVSSGVSGSAQPGRRRASRDDRDAGRGARGGRGRVSAQPE